MNSLNISPYTQRIMSTNRLNIILSSLEESSNIKNAVKKLSNLYTIEELIWVYHTRIKKLEPFLVNDIFKYWNISQRVYTKEDISKLFSSENNYHLSYNVNIFNKNVYVLVDNLMLLSLFDYISSEHNVNYVEWKDRKYCIKKVFNKEHLYDKTSYQLKNFLYIDGQQFTCLLDQDNNKLIIECVDLLPDDLKKLIVSDPIETFVRYKYNIYDSQLNIDSLCNSLIEKSITYKLDNGILFFLFLGMNVTCSNSQTSGRRYYNSNNIIKVVSPKENLIILEMTTGTNSCDLNEFINFIYTHTSPIDKKMIKYDNKLIKLRSFVPNMFDSRYCKKVAKRIQPILLSNRIEILDTLSRGLDVLRYPENGYYYCSNSISAPFIGLIENSTTSSQKYQFLPCCYTNDHLNTKKYTNLKKYILNNKGYVIKNRYLTYNNNVYKTMYYNPPKPQNINRVYCKRGKGVTNSPNKLPPAVEYYTGKCLRIGTTYCNSLLNGLDVNKVKFFEYLLKYYTQYQEFFDMNKEEIIKTFEKGKLSHKLFQRILEKYLNITILVFTEKGYSPPLILNKKLKKNIKCLYLIEESDLYEKIIKPILNIESILEIFEKYDNDYIKSVNYIKDMRKKAFENIFWELAIYMKEQEGYNYRIDKTFDASLLKPPNFMTTDDFLFYLKEIQYIQDNTVPVCDVNSILNTLVSERTLEDIIYSSQYILRLTTNYKLLGY
jgi:hypothetical protein